VEFKVRWEVDYYDLNIKLYCDIWEEEDSVKNLDDIFEFLNQGLEEGLFSPENEVEYHSGDFNIEYVVVFDENEKIMWKESTYKM